MADKSLCKSCREVGMKKKGLAGRQRSDINLNSNKMLPILDTMLPSSTGKKMIMPCDVR
jgi:hypothetical protein